MGGPARLLSIVGQESGRTGEAAVGICWGYLKDVVAYSFRALLFCGSHDRTLVMCHVQHCGPSEKGMMGNGGWSAMSGGNCGLMRRLR